MGNDIRGGILAVCLLGLASSALAGDSVKPLKGIYRGTLHNTCMESPNGFADLPNQVFLGNGNRYADTYTSTAVFLGDGTMTESLHGTTSFLNGAGYLEAESIGTFIDDNCKYAVSMKANKSFTLAGSCTGTLPTGPGAGNNVVVADIDMEGQASEDGSVIIVGSSQPDANTLTLTNILFGNISYFAQRLCAVTGTYVRVKY